MRVELFPFQEIALAKIRSNVARAMQDYAADATPQVVSYTAPTGAGKTIIMASFIESVFHGDTRHNEQPNAIFVWLSDSPELNQQSKDKIDLKADRILLNQTITIDEASFDQETLDDGKIYFLNTQKITKTAKLGKHGDTRQYTIWETLATTAREKSDRLYFIIDEAHRGMQDNKAAEATSIMQKFIKGSIADELPPMPLVIGISATSKRFEALVAGLENSTTRKISTSVEEVRNSGLLKDYIVIAHPDQVNNDMAILQSATDDWMEKWSHWEQYCREQHYAYVNPLFIVQVANGNAQSISETDLDLCVQKIEERTGRKFEEGEIKHTFGQTTSALILNGLTVPYIQPSKISEDRKVKVVFFKENLSTGWDCPRAETMMSFRRANDDTYIAQLLGRIIRSPMQMHIKVDEVLNFVKVFLPFFNAETVEDVIKSLRDSEGGDLPTQVIGTSIDRPSYQTLTLSPRKSDTPTTASSSQGKTEPQPTETEATSSSAPAVPIEPENPQKGIPGQSATPEIPAVSTPQADTPVTSSTPTHSVDATPAELPSAPADDIDRRGIVEYINNSDIPTYEVRSVKIKNYLSSLFDLARFLVNSKLNHGISDALLKDVIGQIHSHIDYIKADGSYEDLANAVMEFKLKSHTYDAFGNSVEDFMLPNVITTSDEDLQRQFRLAETLLGNEGISNAYGDKFYDEGNPNGYLIDIIIFANDANCMTALEQWAKTKFGTLSQQYRSKAKSLSDSMRTRFDRIISNSDLVSEHILQVPETISAITNPAGKTYTNHLFVDENGQAKIPLNGWEQLLIEEEAKQPGFVTWLRNIPRAVWALTIPYEVGSKKKPAYPDFIIVSKSGDDSYVVDVLEPHGSQFTDNLPKAKGFAHYAEKHGNLGRLQLIRVVTQHGQDVIKRLDMYNPAVRQKVLDAASDVELDNIFDQHGFTL